MITQRLIQPPNNVPVVGEDRTVESIWSQFYTALVSAAAPIDLVDVLVSPFDYMASFPGFLLVSGGTVSNLALTRGRVTIATLPMTSGFIPMAQGDIVEITYSVLPDVWFIPNMGGAGGS